MEPERRPIRAAGGVLWRSTPGGIELGIVHRPRYGDWTFPKGKLEGSESELEAAVREVREETGASVDVGADLGTISYQHRGRPKTVRYWAMRALDGGFTATDEIGELRWVAVREVAGVLSYDREREVLRRFVAAVGTAPQPP
ncbi:MAG: NUDIX hydrolase [Euzebyaceae bacterium]|jgi:8-oxo-dGTP diphosphatase|nr:NUDIX hydrolase [Euzebyaceae bacterium]